MFDYIERHWLQVRNDIISEDKLALSGRVCKSYDGSVVAVGGTGHIGNILSNTFDGKVRVYKFNGMEWRQQGPVLAGDSIGSDGSGFCDHFGGLCSLSCSGGILATSARNRGEAPNQGQVHLFAGRSWFPGEKSRD